MIPPRFKDVSFATSKLKEIPDSVLLTGKIGSGKTHYAWCKFKDLLEKDRSLRVCETAGDGRNIIFTTMPDLLTKIKQSFDGVGPTDNQIITIYSTCDYLIIDDLGAEKLSDWARGVLFQIINHRYNYCKNLIITSNLSIDEIAEKFDDRIASRIASMCQAIKLDDQDWRLK